MLLLPISSVIKEEQHIHHSLIAALDLLLVLQLVLHLTMVSIALHLQSKIFQNIHLNGESELSQSFPFSDLILSKGTKEFNWLFHHKSLSSQIYHIRFSSLKKDTGEVMTSTATQDLSNTMTLATTVSA